MRLSSGPRHNFVKRSSEMTPAEFKRFYDFYSRSTNTKAVAEALGISLEMTRRILHHDAISDDSKERIRLALDAIEAGDRLLEPTA